jgi:hypothetical protein
MIYHVCSVTCRTAASALALRLVMLTIVSSGQSAAPDMEPGNKFYRWGEVP